MGFNKNKQKDISPRQQKRFVTMMFNDSQGMIYPNRLDEWKQRLIACSQFEKYTNIIKDSYYAINKLKLEREKCFKELSDYLLEDKKSMTAILCDLLYYYNDDLCISFTQYCIQNCHLSRNRIETLEFYLGQTQDGLDLD